MTYAIDLLTDCFRLPENFLRYFLVFKHPAKGTGAAGRLQIVIQKHSPMWLAVAYSQNEETRDIRL